MARKLHDHEVSALRALAADGHSPAALAERFGISRRHADRLVKGDSQPDAGAELAPGGIVASALDAYLADFRAEGASTVLVAVAQSLAQRLDSLTSATSAAAATASAGVARELAATLRALVPDDDALSAVDQLDRLIEPLRRQNR